MRRIGRFAQSRLGGSSTSGPDAEDARRGASASLTTSRSTTRQPSLGLLMVGLGACIVCIGRFVQVRSDDPIVLNDQKLLVTQPLTSSSVAKVDTKTASTQSSAASERFEQRSVAVKTATPPPTSSPPTPAPLKPTPAPLKATPAPLKDTPPPLKATPAPLKETPPPLKATPAPLKATPAPLKATPAPLKDTPPPRKATPAPLKAAPEPSRATPPPAAQATPSPTNNPVASTSETKTKSDTKTDAKAKKTTKTKSKPDATTKAKTTKSKQTKVRDEDRDCIFKDSPLYRKVYVYPNPGDQGWKGAILSDAGRAAGSNLTALAWPWLALDQRARNTSAAHYNIWSANVQYTTELLVRELMIHPDSCLRTDDPEQATLFYVPYLPSTEHHMGHNRKTDYDTSPYGKAILDILDNNDYTGWESVFGLTSKYWQRRRGSDHILVFSEPMHGLYHPRSRRGNFHFLHSQKQTHPPIVISVELSTTFVSMYPKCAAKNILVPYPNTHGDWFNGVIVKEAIETWQRAANESTAIGTTNQTIAPYPKGATTLPQQGRPVVQFYAAGNHGTCTTLRRSLEADYKRCSPSHMALETSLKVRNNNIGMRLATFCPAPGGDSPSAKRMFDALIAGCIPIVMSHDFVWPFTKEFDPGLALDPADFSIRLQTPDYETSLLDPTTCQPLNADRPSLQAVLEAIPSDELERLQKGALKAGQLFAWYAESERLPQNPLREGILPNGGTAHFVVQALAERAEGVRWAACEEELKLPREKDPTQFKC